VRLRYTDQATARFKGMATGRTYAFTEAAPIQPVHPADADSLLRTGRFDVIG
jgi:hypothetical protein